MSTETQPREELRPFFGVENHNPQELKTEQPHHRAILALLAQGYTAKEVAKMTGFSSTTVQYTWKQPWAQDTIAELQQGAAKRAVESVLNGATLEAAKLIAESIKIGTKMTLGQTPVEGHKLKDSTADAHKLLDRVFGTAVHNVRQLSEEDMQQLSTAELEAIAKGQRN